MKNNITSWRIYLDGSKSGVQTAAESPQTHSVQLVAFVCNLLQVMSWLHDMM